MKKILEKAEADAKSVVSFFSAAKKALFADCHKCGDTGILESGAYCDCRAGAQVIEADVKKEAELPPAPEPKRLPR